MKRRCTDPLMRRYVEKEHIEKLVSDMEKAYIEKFKKYENEGRNYLMSKYFSDKTILEGNISDVKMTEVGETTEVSRFPGYQSYADPANFNDGRNSGPAPNSTSKAPSNVRKRKHSSLKE